MSTAVLRSQDALKSRFHANAFGYRPRPTMNPRRRQPPAPSPFPAPATSPPPPHKSKHTGPTPTSWSPPPKPDRPAPARPGRKPRSAAGAGKDDGGGGAADERRHHRRRLVMEEVTILKRGEAMKPSGPVLSRSNRGDDQVVDPVYAGPGYSVPSPPPSSVPYPAFLQSSLAASEEATRSLLRLLRLNQFAP